MVYSITNYFSNLWNKVSEYAQKIKDAMDKINPFHRESPSLVDWVKIGSKEIKATYTKLATDIQSIDFGRPNLVKSFTPEVKKFKKGTDKIREVYTDFRSGMQNTDFRRPNLMGSITPEFAGGKTIGPNISQYNPISGTTKKVKNELSDLIRSLLNKLEELLNILVEYTEKFKGTTNRMDRGPAPSFIKDIQKGSEELKDAFTNFTNRVQYTDFRRPNLMGSLTPTIGQAVNTTQNINQYNTINRPFDYDSAMSELGWKMRTGG
jgi:hypothetical protein